VRGLAQCDSGGQGIALRPDVIRRALVSLGIEKEESVLGPAGDTNAGFIAGGGVAPRSFVAEVKGVAVISGGLRVVEHGLGAEWHAEDLPQDLRGLAGAQGERDAEGRSQSTKRGILPMAVGLSGTRRVSARVVLERETSRPFLLSVKSTRGFTPRNLCATARPSSPIDAD